jgi:hypothetical protein
MWHCCGLIADLQGQICMIQLNIERLVLMMAFSVQWWSRLCMCCKHML